MSIKAVSVLVAVALRLATEARSSVPVTVTEDKVGEVGTVWLNASCAALKASGVRLKWAIDLTAACAHFNCADVLFDTEKDDFLDSLGILGVTTHEQVRRFLAGLNVSRF